MTPCIMCDSRLVAHQPGTPQICGDCWDGLDPLERAARWDSVRQFALLKEIVIRLEHRDDHARELGRLARVIEDLNRKASPISQDLDTLTGLAERLLRVLSEDEREDWQG